jgi:hypothetical protein
LCTQADARQFTRDRQGIEVDARQSLTEFIVNFPGDPRPLLLADALKFAGQRVQLTQRRSCSELACRRASMIDVRRAVANQAIDEPPIARVPSDEMETACDHSGGIRVDAHRGGTHGGHRAVVLPNNRRANARCRSPV